LLLKPSNWRKTEDLNMDLVHKGKVANVYDLGDSRLLLSRTNRMSGLNAQLTTDMPNKGNILNQLSQWWMKEPLKDIIDNHLLSIPDDFFNSLELESFENNSSVVKKLKPILVEAVVRRHLFGSGYKSYQETGQVCGITLPPGLKNGDRLEEIIFTPTEKTATDDPISFDEMSQQIGTELSEKIRKISLQIFEVAEKILADKNIILVDAKFEFGLDENENLVLMDEVLTPDSSRFWKMEPYETAGKIVSRDKQKARDWLAQKKESGEWDGKSPIGLPNNLLIEISNDYAEIFEQITGYEANIWVGGLITQSLFLIRNRLFYLRKINFTFCFFSI